MNHAHDNLHISYTDKRGEWNQVYFDAAATIGYVYRAAGRACDASEHGTVSLHSDAGCVAVVFKHPDGSGFTF